MRVNKGNTIPSNEKNTIHNVLVIDASGSMSGSKYSTAINGVNAIISDTKSDEITHNTISVMEFSDKSFRWLLEFQPSATVNNFQGGGANGLTPLNDAVILAIRKVLAFKRPEDRVLINVFTDGGENASSNKSDDVRTLIELAKNQNVTVTFQGTKEEVMFAVNSYNISFMNTVTHDNTSAGIAASMTKTRSARTAYSSKVAAGASVDENFYKDISTQ